MLTANGLCPQRVQPVRGYGGDDAGEAGGAEQGGGEQRQGGHPHRHRQQQPHGHQPLDCLQWVNPKLGVYRGTTYL